MCSIKLWTILHKQWWYYEPSLQDCKGQINHLETSKQEALANDLFPSLYGTIKDVQSAVNQICSGQGCLFSKEKISSCDSAKQYIQGTHTIYYLGYQIHK